MALLTLTWASCFFSSTNSQSPSPPSSSIAYSLLSASSEQDNPSTSGCRYCAARGLGDPMPGDWGWTLGLTSLPLHSLWALQQ